MFTQTSWQPGQSYGSIDGDPTHPGPFLSNESGEEEQRPLGQNQTGTRDQVGCCDGSEGPGAAPEIEACQMWLPEGRPDAGSALCLENAEVPSEAQLGLIISRKWCVSFMNMLFSLPLTILCRIESKRY